MIRVRCRTGSRKDNAVVIGERAVRCRTGSLEIIERHGEDEPNVRCRTGSLEKDVSALRVVIRSLPHRQL